MPGKIAFAKDSKDPRASADDNDNDNDKGKDTGKTAESESEGGVPEGTTAEILAWVGDDQDRAQQALDAENKDEKPRTGLTGELNKILGNE
jgi:hypothetical protein